MGVFGAVTPGFPFSKTWTPVSYRGAYTWEPIRNLVFYSMYATAFDPVVATIFNINPGLPVLLTSSRIYETGVKQLLWDNKAEWTFSAYDIVRRNVYQAQGGSPRSSMLPARCGERHRACRSRTADRGIEALG